MDEKFEDVPEEIEDESNENVDIPVNSKGDEVADKGEDGVGAGREELDVSALGEDEIRELAAKAGERDMYYDKYLRAISDMENYRKRLRRDMEISRDAAVMDMARNLLPVLDNFDRALGSADSHKKFKAFLKGITLIEQHLYKALEDGGLERIKAVGEPFDPNFHEAVGVLENPKKPDGTVLEELGKGYVYKGKVVRPAQVRICKNPEG